MSSKFNISISFLLRCILYLVVIIVLLSPETLALPRKLVGPGGSGIGVGIPPSHSAPSAVTNNSPPQNVMPQSAQERYDNAMEQYRQAMEQYRQAMEQANQAMEQANQVCSEDGCTDN